MADLFSLLSQLGNALDVQRAAAATASQNLQNAATPGYSRQRAELGNALPGDASMGAFLGSGVQLMGVSQARDRFVEAQLPAAASAAASAAAQTGALSAITALDPQAAGGLSAALSGFYSSLQALSQDPGEPSLRGQVVAKAGQLANTFRSTAGSLGAARSALDTQLTGQVAEANQLAGELAQANADVRRARAAGNGEPNDLLDARQRIQDQLTELTGATAVPGSNGDVNLLAGGASLVSGDRAVALSAQPDPQNSGHLALLLGGSALSSGALGGSLGGALSARDGALAKAQASVDQLAFDFASRANTVHAAGYAQDGTTGRSLFTISATASGAASAIGVDPAISQDPRLLAAASASTAAAGDGGGVLALLATEDASVSQLSSLTASFGADGSRAKALADQTAAVKDHLGTLRASASGVSIDEEMISLTKAQRAFEAASKVVTTADSMLSTLLSITSSVTG